MKVFNTKLLDFLVCPVSRKCLTYDTTRNILISDDGKYEYKIIDNIPVLIDDELEVIS